MTREPLTRARDDRVVSGAAAGLARHLGVDAGAVRGGFVVATLLGGLGAFFYAWLWAMVPLADEVGQAQPPPKQALTKESRDDEPPAARRKRFPVAELLLGASLVVAGGALVLDRLGLRLQLSVILPALAVLVGVGLAWWQIADRARPERRQLPRILAALALVAVGTLMFFITAREPNAWTVITAALAVLAGVAFAIAPLLLRMNRDLIEERSGRAREAATAEIAAHLHDSVLQTLALIQQRSVPGSDIDRLARGQERELREWLFRGATTTMEESRLPLDAALREHAVAIEGEHAVRFEIVTVGAGVGAEQEATPDGLDALIAAAREAMLNAAKHAGGEVTVFIEVTASRASVDVLDRGPGVDLATIAPERMGISGSIRGRMERAGGTARIGPGPGGAGTSVRLQLSRDTTSAPAGGEEETRP